MNHEDELKRSNAFRGAILEAALDCIVTMDHEGRITEFNSVAEKTFGYRKEDVIGKLMADMIIPPSLRERHTAGLARYLRTGEGPVLGRRIEITGMRSDGTEFPVELAIVRINLPGPPLFTGFIRDISERKRFEDKLSETADRLAQSNHELEQFAYIASHDLQEPLRKIITFSDRLSQTKSDPVEADHLARIQSAASRMKTLIEDLLNFSRVTTMERPFAEVDLNPLVAGVLADLETRIEEVRARVTVGSLPVVWGDESQLRQVFQNLIGNSLKFADRTRPVQIQVESRLDAGRGWIRVRDNGIGFDEKYVDRIFKPFQRLHGKHEYEGTGIGLAICEKIIRRHDGEIRASSRPGEGAAFSFSLSLPATL